VCISGVSAFEYTSTLTRDDLGVCDTYAEFIGDCPCGDGCPCGNCCLCNAQFSGVLDPDVEVSRTANILMDKTFKVGLCNNVTNVEYIVKYVSGNELKLTLDHNDFERDSDFIGFNYRDVCVCGDMLHDEVCCDAEVNTDYEHFHGRLEKASVKIPNPVKVDTVQVNVIVRCNWSFFCCKYIDHHHMFTLEKDSSIDRHELDVVVQVKSWYEMNKADWTIVSLIPGVPIEQYYVPVSKSPYVDRYSYTCVSMQEYGRAFCVF
jgi:hypothetical protein